MSVLIAALVESAANQKHLVAAQAGKMLHDMCDGIEKVITILTQHVEFWSDWNTRIIDQLNGQTTIGIVKESEEEWSKAEAMYKEYASTVSRPR